MRIAALDLSSKCGWAVWEPGRARPLLGTKKLVGFSYDEGSMLEFYRLWFNDFLTTHQPDLLALESWYIPPHMDGATIGKQIMLHGMTMWRAKKRKVRVEKVTAAQWRKHAFGSSRNNGTDWKVRARERCDYLGWTYPDHNAAEAGLILDWAIVTQARLNPLWRDDILMAKAAA